VHTDFLSPWFVRSGVFRSLKVTPPALNRFRLSLARGVIPQAKGIRAVSERVANSIHAAYPSAPMPSVIPIAVSADVPTPLPLPPHEFSFSFITSGRLAPEKRTEDILFALGKLGLHHQSVGLVVVGDGPERPKLERLTAKLGLSHRVLFMGEQGANARAYLPSAQCYIQASAYEGYSRTLVEAALAKIPIITTDVGIVGEVLKGYQDVLATPPGDTANLAAHMQAIIGDHQLRHTLAMNAEHSVRNHLARFMEGPALIAEDLAKTLQ
jgi:glycosyltransferase involved in cell wall biosynthesis